MSDLSILRNKNLTPQFEWMRAVSKEEAEDMKAKLAEVGAEVEVK